MDGTVRAATEADMADICTIVNHYIETSSVNFRTRTQQPQEWLRLFRRDHERYPWLVADVDGQVAGFAHAAAWSERNAYDWCVETTVYVAHQRRGGGVGQELYTELLAGLGAQGYRTAVGVIALPNPGSVALHERLGFRHAGTIQQAGHKLGNWHDVGFWQYHLSEDAGSPVPPTAVGEYGTSR